MGVGGYCVIVVTSRISNLRKAEEDRVWFALVDRMTPPAAAELMMGKVKGAGVESGEAWWRVTT